ncbi:MAG TPA: MmgE/PrpD family protein [Candidatus Binataceae bacterium]|nr:MmgE/PrpD family protein [Candidatus Binataceae bacterium]
MSTSQTAQTDSGVTLALIKMARAINWSDIPADAREAARHCILDCLGTAIAGSREPLTEILVREVASKEKSSQAGLIGRGERASRLSAALINGAAAHALDYDDTHMMMMGHPSVPVIPAVLALAETEGASGRAMLEAIIAGIELECRLGAMMGTAHYAIGFHSTGTLGTFGAAAACAHLLHLDESQWRNALGLAGTQAAGLKSGFGTMAKPLHAGRAASNGLLSALAARGGFTANPEIVETKQGFAATHSGNLGRVAIDQFAGRFVIRDTLFKYSASCYLTHAPIQAASMIRTEHRFDPASIASVEVHIEPGALNVCNIAEPRTGLEGKFSLRATTAMALSGIDTSNLETFTDAQVTDARLVALRDRVTIVPDKKMGGTQAEVIVESRGQRVRAEADSGVPAANLALQRESLTRKFIAITAPVISRKNSERLAEAALHADEINSVSELLSMTRAI